MPPPQDLMLTLRLSPQDPDGSGFRIPYIWRLSLAWHNL